MTSGIINTIIDGKKNGNALCSQSYLNNANKMFRSLTNQEGLLSKSTPLYLKNAGKIGLEIAQKIGKIGVCCRKIGKNRKK